MPTGVNQNLEKISFPRTLTIVYKIKGFPNEFSLHLEIPKQSRNEMRNYLK